MKNDVVYIVSGFSRSGTSMMMNCLSVAGLPVDYTLHDELIDNTTRLGAPVGYDPNPNGYYEYFGSFDSHFYEKNRGKVVKIYFSRLPQLPKGNYKVVFMKRNPEEIRGSMRRWTPYGSWGIEEIPTFFYDKVISSVAELGLEITFLNYADVVANPRQEFAKLKDWGFDIETAALQVDKNLHRVKMEGF